MRNYGGQAMNHLYETQDGGTIALAGSERKFCEQLLTALGRPDFVSWPPARPGPAQAPLIEFLAAIFRTRSRTEWEAFLERSICAGRL